MQTDRRWDGVVGRAILGAGALSLVLSFAVLALHAGHHPEPDLIEGRAVVEQGAAEHDHQLPGDALRGPRTAIVRPAPSPPVAERSTGAVAERIDELPPRISPRWLDPPRRGPPGR